MDSPTTDIRHFAGIFHYNVTIKALKHYEAHVITYDLRIQKFAQLRDVRSLACKLKVFNGRIRELGKDYG